jgi:hypothetical protein
MMFSAWFMRKKTFWSITAERTTNTISTAMRV